MALVLAQNRITEYVIVRPKRASPADKYAAEELARFLNEISGAVFPIEEDDRPETAKELVVGMGARTAAYNLDRAACGKEGFYLKTCGGKLILAGGAPRGTLYAVYTFLEDVLGCRWFTPEISRIPARDCVEIPELDRFEKPVLEYREPFYAEAFDGDWAARNRMNSSSAALTEKHGGKILYTGFVHTFESLVPMKQYFDSHPEYFSEIDGVRIHERPQLCLTNPGVLRLAVEKVREWILKNPDTNIVSVSQNDWLNPCRCEKCRAIDEAEGSHAGTLLRFVNAVAEEIEKEFPDVAIDTLAYQYTRKAPKITKPRHNVIVRLCSIECCFTHPLGTCPDVLKIAKDAEVQDFAQDLRDWSKICSRLYIWDYVTAFSCYLLPFPNAEILRDNIRLFADHNVKGIFEEGCYNTKLGYCAELNSYLLAKFLWNPDYDFDKALWEYLTAVYGGAAAAMRAIFAGYREQVVSENFHLRFNVKPNQVYKDPKFLQAMSRLFDEAERAADNETILARVRKARLWQRFLELSKNDYNPPDKNERIDRLTADCAAAGMTRYCEWCDIDAYVTNWKQNGLK